LNAVGRKSLKNITFVDFIASGSESGSRRANTMQIHAIQDMVCVCLDDKN